MSHLKTYRIFPDNWEKTMEAEDLSDARLQMKSYVTTKDVEVGIREVIQFFIFKF